MTKTGNSSGTIASRLAAACLLAFISASLPAAVSASELSGSIALTSQYIYRGQALSDGGVALQGGVDYAHDVGLFAGAWASTIDFSSPSGQRDTQVNYYAGYHYAPDSPFSASLSVIRYTYPGQSGSLDYDYNEALLTVVYDDKYSLEVGHTNEYYGFNTSSRNIELRGEWPLKNGWVISTGIGHNDVDANGVSGYVYGDAGASARFSRVTVDLRWYNNETPQGFLGRWSAGSEFVATLSLAF